MVLFFKPDNELLNSPALVIPPRQEAQIAEGEKESG
jgi:hypothetical protein